MCDNDFYAKQVVLYFPGRLEEPEIDKKQIPGYKYYYYHYHTDRNSHRHIWFLGVPWSE